MSPQEFFFYAGLVGQEDFHTGAISYITNIVICPIEYWNKNKHISDFHLTGKMNFKLPCRMGEIEESLFETDESVSNVRNSLIELGMQENDEFSAFCKRHDPFLYK